MRAYVMRIRAYVVLVGSSLMLALVTLPLLSPTLLDVCVCVCLCVCVCVCVCIERERETDRQSEREKDRENARPREREPERDDELCNTLVYCREHNAESIMQRSNSCNRV